MSSIASCFAYIFVSIAYMWVKKSVYARVAPPRELHDIEEERDEEDGLEESAHCEKTIIQDEPENRTVKFHFVPAEPDDTADSAPSLEDMNKKDLYNLHLSLREWRSCLETSVESDPLYIAKLNPGDVSVLLKTYLKPLKERLEHSVDIYNECSDTARQISSSCGDLDKIIELCER
jgi:hypothetical protein